MTSDTTQHFQMTDDECHLFCQILTVKIFMLNLGHWLSHLLNFFWSPITKDEGAQLLVNPLHISASPHMFANAIFSC